MKIERNPNFVFNNISINTIGDPHLGRQFKNSVPKNRLNDRELFVQQTFIDLLNPKVLPDYIIIMGDLLDKTTVKNSDVLFAIKSLEEAVKKNTKTHYILLAGNHDLVKDKTIKSSFDIIVQYFLTNCFSNFDIVLDKILVKNIDESSLIFVPYNPFINLNLDLSILNKNKIAFGHWEITDFSAIGGTSNLNHSHIPEDILTNCDLIVSGHEHKPTYYKKTKTLVTGSMQPYAHGEQLEDELLYITHSLDKVKLNLATDINYYCNSNLRILIDSDQEPIKNLNCFSLTYLYNKFVKKEDIVIEENVDVATEIQSNSTSMPLSFNTLVLNRLVLLKEENEDLTNYLQDCFLNKSYDNWSYEN